MIDTLISLTLVAIITALLIKNVKLLVILFPFFTFFDNLRALFLTPSEIAMLFIILFSIKSISKKTNALEILIYIYLASIITTSLYHAFYSEIDNWSTFAKDISKASLGVIFALVIKKHIRDYSDLRKVVSALMLMITITIFLTLAVIMWHGSFTVFRELSIFYDPTIDSNILSGTILFNPNHIARTLYLSFPIIMIYAIINHKKKLTKRIPPLLIGFSLIIILSLLSRMGIIVSAISLIIISIAFKNKQIGSLLIIVTISLPVMLALVGDKFIERVEKLENFEEQARVVAFRNAIDTISKHPVTGTGAGSFKRITEEAGLISYTGEGKASHNNFIFLAVQFGLPSAFLFFTIILYLILKFYIISRRKFKQHRLFLISGSLTTFSYLLAGMTATIFGMEYFWFLLGIFIAHHQLFTAKTMNTQS